MHPQHLARQVPAATDIVDGPNKPGLRPASRCRALVVDDDDIVRTQLMGMLKRSGYDVRGAASGEEALRSLDVGDCQVLVTDWQMPRMNGLDLCRHVRLGRPNQYVYVLMLTVRDQEQDVLVGLAAGADDYVVKGAPNEEILARLELGRRITQCEYPLAISTMRRVGR
jgi:DNA-binding response OmpR family regulator